MKSIAITGLSGLASATPILVARDTFCGQWDSEVSGPYTIFNNLWGQDNADEGEQCTTNNGLSADDKLSWSVEWTWVGGESSVKSYPNVVVESDPAPLSDVSSIQAEWAWTYTGEGDFTANVAFDLFSGETADGDAAYEFMIWLGAFGGAGPISSTGSPIDSADLASSTWDLYQGVNGQMTVFSFVASSGNVESFSGDLTEFTNYLVSNHNVANTQVLQSVGAGTEPFVGTNVVFTTSSYAATVA